MKLTKELLRERMPLVSQVVDQFRAEFGQSTKVLWAKEGDFEVGKVPPSKSIVIEYYVEDNNKGNKKG